MRAINIIGFLLVISLILMQLGSRSAQHAAGKDDVQRGRYLVEEVAKCTECHTPRDQNNQLDHDRWLQGSSIWIQPVHPMPDWAEFAPPLAGLPGLTDEQAERVLEMGEGAGGTPIQPPMHIYHLNHADAESIVAYLRSLPAPNVH
jgi:mono/diheme cytochrome c family protein